MNLIQRIIILVGTVSMVITLLTTPKFVIYNGQELKPSARTTRGHHARYDLEYALIRFVIAVTATTGLVLVFSDKQTGE